MNISNIINTITETLDSVKTPAKILPPLLLRCTSLMRTGLSAYRIASRIIQNNKTLGIPEGDNPDGTTNLINAYTYNFVKEFVNAIKNEATVQVAVPANSVLFEGKGGNAGGPIVVIGSNILDSIANGIMQ